ncbi:hypothetical protein [Alphaspiravirus yamagawaense]|uniref:Uncharacterized protein n=1 Tax=Alphaspiravirus yamagawaense TaxID=1157339 RepID=J7Q324_9VIRU|nr:hypothetical protein [Aeropyrum coil-shaped virus]CCG27828.1 hypothetical protein [Aeropyrum coil-shaped virus]
MASPFDLSQIFQMIVPIMMILFVVMLVSVLFRSLRGAFTA